MDVYYGLDNIREYSNVIIALGNFDGIHLGHRKLIETTVDLARQVNGTAAVLTFDPHPLKLLQPELCPPMLLSREDKIRIMSELEVKLLVITPFSRKFAHLTPELFVKNILIDKFKVKGVVVGYNYTFGFKGEGNSETMSILARQHGIESVVVPPVKCSGVEVSSTLIRSLLIDGQVSDAAKFLGYCPFVFGQVVTGYQRGRQIGFPTANLVLSEEVLAPANGVYAVRINLDGHYYRGVANVGLRPTFKLNHPRNLEVHIFDFCGDIYGEKIKVEFVERIRGEREFESVNELIGQIHKDSVEAKRTLDIKAE